MLERHSLVSRGLCGVIGIVFLVSALGKAGDVGFFEHQIQQIIPEMPNLSSLIAMELILIETVFAAALLSGSTYRGWLFIGITVSLAIFSVFLLYGAVFLDIKDCGCFGNLLKMGPGAALIKNGALLVLTGIAWATGPPCFASSISRKTLTKLIFAFGPFVLMTAALAHGLGDSRARLEYAGRSYARFDLEIDGGRFDMSKGEYFVALLSTGCGPCARRVPELNGLPAKHPDMPPIIGLCIGNEDAFKRFCETTRPEFPLTLIPPEDFMRLIGRVTPRFVYVRDGEPIQIWDSIIPDPPPSRVGK